MFDIMKLQGEPSRSTTKMEKQDERLFDRGHQGHK